MTKDLNCIAGGTPHLSAVYKAGCPVCNPTKTVPELNAGAREARTSNDMSLPGALYYAAAAKNQPRSEWSDSEEAAIVLAGEVERLRKCIPDETTGYVLPSACVKALIEAADRAGVEHVTFGVMDPKSGFPPDLPGYIGVIREDVSKLKETLRQEEPSEPRECNHPRSELLARKGDTFEMRKCLECTKIFRVRPSVPAKCAIDKTCLEYPRCPCGTSPEKAAAPRSNSLLVLGCHECGRRPDVDGMWHDQGCSQPELTHCIPLNGT